MDDNQMYDEWPEPSRPSWRDSTSPWEETHLAASHAHRPDTGKYRSRWLIAGVVLSLVLLSVSVLGAIAATRHTTPTTPASSIGAYSSPSSATATQSTTINPTATQSATPAVTNTMQPTPKPTVAPQAGPFQLVFDDEFNGSSINQNAWSLYSGTPGGNTATQWVPGVCREQNGMLILPILAQPAKGRPLSACGMSGEPASTQTYGKYEYRARLDPGYDWYGMFLLWPNSGNWPTDGEIDNCEYDAGDVARNHCAMTVHWAADNQQVQTHATGDFTQWHVYTIIWLPQSITYQIDGQTVWVETTHVPNDPMWPAFQNQGNGDASQLGAEYVDYIHIYKYTG
ncbi:MAG TPA: family 16 glycosylhydrolase [Ktedonobacterales bacterium]|nr:family 16 glycosylhydrolase [Ktedonobacterales bacterium]